LLWLGIWVRIGLGSGVVRRSEMYHVRYGWADVGDGNCGGIGQVTA